MLPTPKPLLATALLALACVTASAQTTQPGKPTAAAAPAATAATAAPATGAPAGFVAPAEPKPGESNAERSKSQPGNNAPMWSAVRDSGNVPGVTSLPGAEKGVLIQSMVQYPGSARTTAGEAWRQVRNNWIIPYGGSLLLIVGLAIGIFYWRRGSLGHANNDGAPAIERFTPFERAAHWTNAICFVILAVSGIVMAFGKHFLLPVIGSTLFGWLTYALKTAHNFAGPVFAVSLVVVVVTFVKDNIAKKADLVWVSKGGGMLGGEEIPSHRFNGGEKGLFWWGILFPGVVVIASGLVLDLLIPGLGQTRGQMQIAHMLHAVAGIWMMCALAGHIYMGTIGAKGAFKAMRTGWVDEAWAKEHHGLWYDDIKAGRIPARRSQEARGQLGQPAAQQV
ncbi:MAG: formate dehydrogenase subunit gamma [Rubrivivax sp.]|jgi:formate dehydrogenase subunit gamma|nr:formate dehydrogenase subunit gamma [Rubrivivax sp.]